jgi:hypothetical protein
VAEFTEAEKMYAEFLAKSGGARSPQVADLFGSFVRMRTHHPASAAEMLQRKLRALDDEQVLLVAAVIAQNEAVAPRDRVKVRRAVLEYQEGAGDRKPQKADPPAPADMLYPARSLALDGVYARGCFQEMLGDERLRPAPRRGPGGPAAADVTTGVWTCCGAVQRDSAGCKESGHSLRWAPCGQCGLWFDCEGPVGACKHHAAEPTLTAGSAAIWACCGAIGYDGSKYELERESEAAHKKETIAAAAAHTAAAGQAQDIAHGAPRAPVRRSAGVAAVRMGCATGVHRRDERRLRDSDTARCCLQCGEEWSKWMSEGSGRCVFHSGVWCEVRPIRYIDNLPKWRAAPADYDCNWCGVASVVKAHKAAEHRMECLQRPQLCSYCGEIFPHAQLEAHMHSTCPKFLVQCADGCGATIERSAEADHREVCDRVVIHCPRECGAHFQRDFLSRHVAVCPLKLVLCDNLGCNKLIPQPTKNEHLAQCQYGLQKCEHCFTVLMRRELALHVEQACPEVAVTCPNNCGEAFKRSQLADHTQNLCPRTILPCPNDCGAMMQRQQLATHEAVCELSLVFCPLGCGVCYKRDDAESHTFDCIFKPVTCPRCLKLVPEADIKLHNDVCTHMKVLCPQCGEAVRRLNLNEHIRHFCVETAVDCVNLCGERPTRRLLHAHLREACPLQKLPCPYKCGDYWQRNEMCRHMEWCVREFLPDLPSASLCPWCGISFFQNAFPDHIIRCKHFKPWEVHWKLQDPAILRGCKLIPEKKRYDISAPSAESSKQLSDSGVRVAKMLFANAPSPRPSDFVAEPTKGRTMDGRRGSVSGAGRRGSILGAGRRASITATSDQGTSSRPRRGSIVTIDRDALSAMALEKSSDIVVATSEHLSGIAKRVTQVRS